MYDTPDSKYSKLVMAARKAKTETLGGSVPEARAKSAVVKLETQPKVASSDQLYEAITQQIMYLISAITNQNANNDRQNGPRCNNGGGNITKTQRPKKDRKDMICWGCRGTGHGWRECLTPREGNNLPFKPVTQNLNGRWGEETQTSNPPPVLTREESASTNN